MDCPLSADLRSASASPALSGPHGTNASHRARVVIRQLAALLYQDCARSCTSDILAAVVQLTPLKRVHNAPELQTALRTFLLFLRSSFANRSRRANLLTHTRFPRTDSLPEEAMGNCSIA